MLQAFDPNEWCPKNGLLSGGLEPTTSQSWVSCLTTRPRCHVTCLVIICLLLTDTARHKVTTATQPKCLFPNIYLRHKLSDSKIDSKFWLTKTVHLFYFGADYNLLKWFLKWYYLTTMKIKLIRFRKMDCKMNLSLLL